MIRPAVQADHAALLDLWEGLQANGTLSDPRYRPTPDARREMATWTRTAWFDNVPFPRVLLVDDDGPKAFIHAFPRVAIPVVDLAPTARIADLYVAPSHRRQGWGKALVDELRRRALRMGYPRLEVGTLTRDQQAVGFWTAMGFGDWQVTLVSDQSTLDQGSSPSTSIPSGSNSTTRSLKK